ncbi:MAG: DUF4185 domain-containing protein [Bacteroidetes bacterium]|nr:MAG: DUF4185 domain-containing protein [Bacteroidota bacterium]
MPGATGNREPCKYGCRMRKTMINLLQVNLVRPGIPFAFAILTMVPVTSQLSELKPEILRYEPFVWDSKPPPDCPFEQSGEFSGIRFLGIKSGYHYGDTWYPTWASNDTLYSPWTDGKTRRLDGYTDWSQSWVDPKQITTGQGVIVGDDPLTMIAYSIGLDKSSPAFPYRGRYPCGSLVYNGVWYYGTYILDPAGPARYGDQIFNSPWIGAFVGFRYSTDYGHTWTPCPHTPADPIFGETGLYGYPVKIGSPHFVDFGKNMQHSPDGKAYMVAHGADTSDTRWRFGNDSWITGDQVYLIRVTPSIETINDASCYEFYGGRDAKGDPVWTGDFGKIKPLLEWNNNMGCVTITYNAPLKNYIMCVTDGGNTYSRMNTYLLESDHLTGEWKLVTYMKAFGEQGYFVNIPSKFISKEGTTAWLLYSANYSDSKDGKYYGVNPPGSHYGITFQKIRLLKGK